MKQSPFLNLLAAAFVVAAAGCSSTGSTSSAVPLSKIQAAPAFGEAVTFTQFKDLPKNNFLGGYFPVAIANGPDGALWVADDIDQDAGASAVARIDVTGRRTATFYYPNQASPAFEDIAAGPDNALWVTDSADSIILRYSTQGKRTSYSLNGAAPLGITKGPDGALWFALLDIGPYIARITTSGQITKYSKGISSGAIVYDIAAGPDGALWFTEEVGDRIGRITTTGTITEFSAGITSGSEPFSIAAGPDGALWFTELKGGRIGRITTAGKVTEYSQGISQGEHPTDIAAGPGNKLWITENTGQFTGSKIASITTAGTITEYSGIPGNADPVSIVQGPDHNMWFVDQSTNRTGRVNL